MKTLNYKNIAFVLVMIIITFLLFKNCNDKSKYADRNDKYLKSNDSLNVLYQKGILETEKFERNIKQLNKDLLVAHNNSQVAETRYYQLQRFKAPPLYIENITDCNDTVQKIHLYAVTKDSLCTSVILAKNIEIKNQDSIITQSNLQKNKFIGLLELEKNAKNNLNGIIDNNKKEIRNEKNKKNFWKLTAVTISGLLIWQKLK
ncbi:MAG: hypothetical protein H7221_04955 [Flavobacterium sp.]|nr:hypothetical protein [Flavobacterium sp.]